MFGAVGDRTDVLHGLDVAMTEMETGKVWDCEGEGVRGGREMMMP